MRRARARVRVLLAVAAAVALASPAARPAAAAEDAAARAVSDLDAASWVVRRKAERALEAEGEASLGEGADPARAKARAEAFAAAVEAGLASGRPSVERALLRLLARLEKSGAATDDRVRALPRLLRRRVERLAGTVVGVPETPRFDAGFPFPGSEPVGDPVAAGTVRGLLPEARAALLGLVRTSGDARRVAGAIALLADETGEGRADADLAEALAALPRRDAALAAEVGLFEAWDGTHPVSHVALALALAGDAARIAPLLRRASPLAGAAAVDLARRRLPEAGRGDVAQADRFLDESFKGTWTVAHAAEAARRALDAGLPWIARLLARRALFLDASDASARATLVASALALGLGATAREDAAGIAPVPASAPATDDEAAKAADALLREGAFGRRRLVWRLEAGRSPHPWATPVSAARGTFVHGSTVGEVVVSTLSTTVRLDRAFSTVRALPRAVALSGTYVACVSFRGDLVAWRLQGGELTVAHVPTMSRPQGPWALVAASATEGEFLVASRDGTIFSFEPGEEPRPRGERPAKARGMPVSLAALGKGAALVGGDGWAERVDLGTGAATTVVEGQGAVVVAPWGDDVLVAGGTRWERRAADGTVRAAHDAPSAVVGVVGDPASGVVYLAAADAVVALREADGATLWSEPVEASASPVLGGSLLLVPAGRGRADGREDRTITALRPGPAGFDPFDEASRAKVVAAGKRAFAEGKVEVARLLLDPVLDVLPAPQRAEVESLMEPRGPDGAPLPEDEEDGR